MTAVLTMTRRLIVLLIAGILAVPSAVVWGWSNNHHAHSKTGPKAGTMAHAASRRAVATTTTATRRDALQVGMVGILGGATAFLSIPVTPVHADITNKVASSAALRNLQRAEKALPKLKTSAASNDYVAVKAFMRTPPFDEVRKNGSVLVRGGEDLGLKAVELQQRYKTFIASLEKIDGTASVGIRGRSIDPIQLTAEYDSVQVAMAEFLKVAEEGVKIPVQE